MKLSFASDKNIPLKRSAKIITKLAWLQDYISLTSASIPQSPNSDDCLGMPSISFTLPHLSHVSNISVIFEPTTLS